MLTNEQAKADVVRLFSDKLMIAVTDSQTDLLASGLLDSAGLVDLLLLLEEKFGVRLNMEDLDMEDFKNCESIAALVVANAAPSATWKGELASAIPTPV